MMDKPLIEVYVEKFYPSCKEVLHNLQSLASSDLIDMEIFRKEKDNAVFEGRNVSICPATSSTGSWHPTESLHLSMFGPISFAIRKSRMIDLAN